MTKTKYELHEQQIIIAIYSFLHNNKVPSHKKRWNGAFNFEE